MYTLAIGNNSNNGLTPQNPKTTIQNIIDSYDLGPTDIVVIDTGTFSKNITLNSVDEGAIYAGSALGSVLDSIGTVFEIIDSDYNFIYGLVFGGSTGIYAHGDGVNPSSNNTLKANALISSNTGIYIVDGDSDIIEDNAILGSGTYGIRLQNNNNLSIQNNSITGRTYSVHISGNGINTSVLENILSNGTRGIHLEGSSTTNLQLLYNDVNDFSGQGIYCSASDVSIIENKISQCNVGIESSNSSTRIKGNVVSNNTTGVKAYGTIGPDDQSSGLYNDIFDNTIGIWARNGAQVQFNRIHHNTKGLSVPEDSVLVHHNVIYRNTEQGILLNDGDNVAIENNTIYSPSGDCIRIENNSSNVSLENNILWTEGGYDLYVETNCQNGFTSNYNNLFSSSTGKLVWWQKDFTDLFDWQVEAYFDNDSIGYTSIDPNRDNPQFADSNNNDYHLQDEVSTSIDAGDPYSLFGNEATPNGNRINLGAYGNTSEAAFSPAAYISVDSPDYYTDLEADMGQFIIWHTFDDTEPNKEIADDVDIDLYEEGVGKVADIAVVSANDLSLGWTPSNFGITGDISKRYRILITSVDKPSISNMSREPFSIVPSSQNYYIDDVSDVNDQYTPGAIGSNRNTGHTPADPKANLLPILHIYDLGPGDLVYMDTGDYIHVRNVLISGNPTKGNDEGVTITGPDEPNATANINRANQNPGAAVIEIDEGDYVTLKHLSLSGAERGLWVHSCTDFAGQNLSIYNNKLKGVYLDFDSVNADVNNCIVNNNGDGGINVIGSSSSVGNCIIYNNENIGINASQGANVLNNTVYGHEDSEDIGIQLDSGVQAKENIVHDNYYGIQAGNGRSSAGTAINNRIYNNTVGIAAHNGSFLSGNYIYSNGSGIKGMSTWNAGNPRWYSGTASNNLIYDNSDYGIQGYMRSAKIINNVVYQEVGDAVNIYGESNNVKLRNNILWVDAGYCISVASDSQVGFDSNYNLFTGPGTFAKWGSVEFSGRSEWFYELGLDHQSIVSDPNFIDIDGVDDILGFSVEPNGLPVIVDNNDLSCSIEGTWSYVDDSGGYNNDYHQNTSADGLATWTFTGLIPEATYEIAVTWKNNGQWTNSSTALYEVYDGNDFTTAKKYKHYDSPNDFEDGGVYWERLGYFKITDGNLTVTLSSSSTLTLIADAVRIQEVEGDHGFDDDFHLLASSHGIDAGDLSSDYAEEPVPNGGRINLGVYGNRPQASTSPERLLQVLSPIGLDKFEKGQQMTIQWRSDGLSPAGTVDIELMEEGNPVPVLAIASDKLNDGIFDWIIPISLVDSNYYISISSSEVPGVTGQALNTFQISNDGPDYYVNILNDNDLTDNEYTAASGSNTNSGKSPDSPMLSLNALIAAYDLDPNDIIYVDTGIYDMTANIIIDADDAGVTILGAQQVGNETILNRGNPGSGSYVFELIDADGVTLKHLSITGGYSGIYASSSSDSDNAMVSNCNVYSNTRYGISLDGGNDLLSVIANEIHDNRSDNHYGIRSLGTNCNINSNTVYSNYSGIYISGSGSVASNNLVHNNSSMGITAVGDALVTDNEVYSHYGSGNIGIDLSGNAQASENVVHGNYYGISAKTNSIALNNRVYNNSNAGIIAYNYSTIRENILYSNTTGIRGDYYIANYGTRYGRANASKFFVIQEIANASPITSV